MMMGIKIEGFRRFKRTFVRGSKMEYEMKNIVKAALYFPVDMLCKLFCNPSTLALPMFVRSRNARRYRMQSYRVIRFGSFREIGILLPMVSGTSPASKQVFDPVAW